MSAPTVAARDILGLSSPEFIEVPGFYVTLRLDEIMSVTTNENSVLVRLKSNPTELVTLRCGSRNSRTHTYNKLVKLLMP